MRNVSKDLCVLGLPPPPHSLCCERVRNFSDRAVHAEVIGTLEITKTELFYFYTYMCGTSLV